MSLLNVILTKKRLPKKIDRYTVVLYGGNFNFITVMVPSRKIDIDYFVNSMHPVESYAILKTIGFIVAGQVFLNKFKAAKVISEKELDIFSEVKF